MLETLQSIRLFEVADLVVVWALVWAGIAWLRTTPARLALLGLGILVAGYLAARQLGLVLTTSILQSFAAVSVLIIVVVFQQDLRRLFEQIAALGLRRRSVVAPDAIDTVLRAITTLAEQRRGALVVIPGREPIDTHVDGGVKLDAAVSEPLLLSLFDPHSPGHDGAVILERGRIERFAVHLPLSTDHEQLGQRGTRHAAALGLAERTDALCIAVSEERGTISLAEAGRLRLLASPAQVAQEVRRFLSDLTPEGNEPTSRLRWLFARWREALLAVPISALLWVLSVPGGTVVEIEREVPISIAGVPPSYEVESVDPTRAQVVLAGRRRDLYLLSPEALSVRVDAVLVDMGRRSFSLSPANVRHPEDTEVLSIRPETVKISLRDRGESAGSAAR